MKLTDNKDSNSYKIKFYVDCANQDDDYEVQVVGKIVPVPKIKKID